MRPATASLLATQAVTGKLTATDADQSENVGFDVMSATAEKLGTFDTDALGAWSYKIDNSRSETQALTLNQSEQEIFSGHLHGADREPLRPSVLTDA